MFKVKMCFELKIINKYSDNFIVATEKIYNALIIYSVIHNHCDGCFATFTVMTVIILR